MNDGVEALINRQMIILARKQSGLDEEAAAKKISVSIEKFKSWEDGLSRPTINQAIKMAEVYHRPLSYFYLREAPKDFTVAITDFRRTREGVPPKMSPALFLEQRRAEMRREVMLELTENQDDLLFEHFNTITLNENPEKIADQIRNWLGISWNAQKQWRETTVALSVWRRSIEDLNVLVCHTSHQGLKVDLAECRGFSLSVPYCPVIVMNSSDSYGGRIFTLLHEFAHILLNKGGICNLEQYSNIQNTEQRVEIYCNHVAGSVLVPEGLLKSHAIVERHNRNLEWDDEEIYNLSVDFSTSEEVIVRRLLILGIVTQEFYEMKRRHYGIRWGEIKEKKKQKKSKGGPPQYRMAVRQNGRIFTQQVFSSYHENQMNLLDVADVLGVRMKHLKAIEQEAYFGGKGGQDE